jgi:hypothetical protein
VILAMISQRFLRLVTYVGWASFESLGPTGKCLAQAIISSWTVKYPPSGSMVGIASSFLTRYARGIFCSPRYDRRYSWTRSMVLGQSLAFIVGGLSGCLKVISKLCNLRNVRMDSSVTFAMLTALLMHFWWRRYNASSLRWFSAHQLTGVPRLLIGGSPGFGPGTVPQACGSPFKGSRSCHLSRAGFPQEYPSPVP